MIHREDDGRLTWSSTAEESCPQAKETCYLDLELLARHDDLLDRVFAFAFDTLGVRRLELRIRAFNNSAPYQ
jgi:hypothetical protein